MKDGTSYRVVVPARYASTRLPGKPLVDIGGRPMVVRVMQRALASGTDAVVVATDDRRVADAVVAAGGEVEMTRAEHPSGSDRVMEVAERRGWADSDIVVNVQGDEPLIPPAVIDQVANLLASAPGAGAATLSEPIGAVADVFDPNIVKVVASLSGRAMCFSRAPLPWHRDAFADGQPSTLAGDWKRHIGIYAYRVGTLRRFVSLPQSAIERTEALEQLRLLDNDIDIVVAEAVAPVPGGVDTEADAERVRAALAAR